MFGKCLPLKGMEAEKIFWRSSELVEILISFLDPVSILALAKTSSLVREVLQRGLNWSRLIKRTCPEQLIILQQPFEQGLATAEKALEPIIEILKVLDKSEYHLLQLLDIICERFPSNNTSAGPDQVKMAMRSMRCQLWVSCSLRWLKEVLRLAGNKLILYLCGRLLGPFCLH